MSAIALNLDPIANLPFTLLKVKRESSGEGLRTKNAPYKP